MNNPTPKQILAIVITFIFIDIVLSATLSESLTPMDNTFCQVAKDMEYVATNNSSGRFYELMDYLSGQISANAPIGEIIVAAGGFFTGTEYVAGILDQYDDEKLIINLEELDCVTFVEYVLAGSLVYKAQQTSFNDFAAMVKHLRYRNGILKGYASRLHYFTDWLQNNSRKGILMLAGNEFGTGVLSSAINFMSSNAHLYKQLNDLHTLRQITDYEQVISSYDFRYVPCNQIRAIEELIQDGDIIAFATTVNGLDVSHTGIAVFRHDRLHLMHASFRSKMVEITKIPLHDYLSGNKNVKGIIVGRVI